MVSMARSEARQKRAKLSSKLVNFVTPSLCSATSEGILCIHIATKLEDKSIELIAVTGSMTSIIMTSCVNTNFVTPTVTRLRTFNGDSIKTFGRMSLSISILSLLCEEFFFTFFIADVKDNILGGGYLNDFKTTVTCDNLTLTDNITGLSTRQFLTPIYYS